MCRFMAPMIALALLASPVAAQDYWEYSPWEGEWEHHRPTQGLEYEYENENGVDVEREQYEWEPGEGYHEQEWYDPSDWFNGGNDLEYESDDWSGYGTSGYDYDANDEDLYGFDYGLRGGGLDYGWHYVPDEGTWEYGWHHEGTADFDAFDYDYDYYDTDADLRDVDYQFDQQVTGEVLGLQRMRSEDGRPQSVRLRLRTDDGQVRTVHLGDVAYVNRYLPRLRQGDEVVIGGRQVEADGRTLFKAEEIRAGDRRYLVPEYLYQRRIEGRLVGLRKVRIRDGRPQAVVAKVRTDDGRTRDVLLGSEEDLERFGRDLRPGARAQLRGYRREVDGRSRFVVQDVKVLQQGQGQDRSQRRRPTRQNQGQQQQGQSQ